MTMKSEFITDEFMMGAESMYEQNEGLNFPGQNALVAQEYMQKYPSVAKIYEAIASSRRLCSEGTVENYINYVAKFVKFLGYVDPEKALEVMLSGKVNAGEKIDPLIGYALYDLGKSHSTVRNYIFGVKKWCIC